MTRAKRPRFSRYALGRIREWFSHRGWQPFDFQLSAWKHYLAGESGLIHAPTGIGKTYAAWMGPFAQWLAENPEPGSEPPPLAFPIPVNRLRSRLRSETLADRVRRMRVRLEKAAANLPNVSSQKPPEKSRNERPNHHAPWKPLLSVGGGGAARAEGEDVGYRRR